MRIALALTALLLAAPVVAQEPKPAPAGQQTVADTPAWLSSVIDLDIKELPFDKAIARVLELAGADTGAPTVRFPLPTQKLTLVLPRVTVRDALAAISRLAGAQTFVTTQQVDGKRRSVVEMHPRKIEGGVSLPTGIPILKDIPIINRLFTIPVPTPQNQERWQLLSQDPVTVTVIKADAATLLRDVCKQVGVDCRIEGTLPAGNAFTIGLTAVQPGQALDMAASFVSARWKATRDGDRTVVTFTR